MPELEAVAVLARVAESRGLRVLLIGAFARQIVFDQQHEGRPYRATRDIDVGVRVATWNEYGDLITALVSAGFIREAEHKLRYRDGTEFDLLPFGGVVDEHNQLTWRGSERVMSMDGFNSADAHGELRDVAGVQLRVANLPGLITLKLFAFRDRGTDPRSSDLGDLNYILSNASDALQERVYTELSPAQLEALDYPELGPYLLGRDVARTVSRDEAASLSAILDTRVLVAPDYALLSRAARLSSLEGAVADFRAFKQGLEDDDVAART